MIRQIVGAIVLALFAALMLAGCAAGRPSLIGGVARLPFAVVGATTEVLVGTNIFPSEVQRKIEEYCGAPRYRGRDFATCKNGAYGSFIDRRYGSGYGYDSYLRNSSGLAAGRLEHDRQVWEDGENFGRSLGNSGY